ncbi:MAG TPA: cupin domain-containing protein [Candidatus Limnocylindrales bacterium]|nr:cupin domain-containing protein [Candidatus Limnocylindrales bacterium]
MRNRLMVALTAALLGAAAVAGIVLATDAVGVSSRTLATGSLDEVNLNVKTEDWKVQLRTKGVTDVTTVENTVVPGGSFGWHSHPGPSIIIVKSGTITFYHGDDPTCAPHAYHAGQALVDTGNEVHIGRNEGTEDVVVIVTRLIPAGDAPRDGEPASGFCGFDQVP